MIFWADKVEKWLKYIVIWGMAILVLSQAILFREEARPYLSRVDRLEGEKVILDFTQYATSPLAISERSVVSKRAPVMRDSRIIIIRMIQPTADWRIFATISGEQAGDFSRGEVKLTVYDGDYVEIDCSALKNQASFVVNVPGNGLASPLDGLVIETQGSIAAVGKIKFK